jgi:ABC-type amino acid transport substrate-binding protein
VAEGLADALVDGNATWPLHPQAPQLRALPGLVSPPTDAGSPYFAGSGAIITRRSDSDLNVAIAVALNQLATNGTLKTVLTKWHLYGPGVTDFIRVGS